MSNFTKDPSWGMIGLNRTYCGGKGQELFGSDVTNHSTIMLRVKHAQKSRELGRDWVMGDDLVCEVELSSNQFAEMLTNMNVGDGVPCTIRYTQKDGNIPYTSEKSKLDVILEDRDKQNSEMADKVNQVLEGLQRKLADGRMSLSKTDCREYLYLLRMVYNYLNAEGSDFLRKQAKEEIDVMVLEAKTQVSDYVNHKIFSVGLEHLLNESEVSPHLLDSNN